MTTTEKLFDFIKSSPSPYHTVKTVAEMLEAAGFKRIYEGDGAPLECGTGYYVIRDGSSIIAFRKREGGYMISAAHSDSPSFKAKFITQSGAYFRLNTERYGGMILYSWLDRPLSVAGRVILRTERGIKEATVDLDADMFTIPSLAIHMNREVNNGYKFNPATDMLPITSHGVALDAILADKLGVSADEIISHDLYLYARDAGKIIADEYILSPRLDDLQCVYSATEAFLAAEDSECTPVLAIFDNEEVGSSTKQGAASDFLSATLRRIASDECDYRRRLASSFMVSADNAHAIHPAHPELADKDNAPVMNGGIVIKFNASQRYTTDSVSASLFKAICKKANVPTQVFANRSDMAGGSTLGNIATTKVSVKTVDIGLAQLAMHSACETAGARDVDYMIDACRAFFSSALETRDNTIVLI